MEDKVENRSLKALSYSGRPGWEGVHRKSHSLAQHHKFEGRNCEKNQAPNYIAVVIYKCATIKKQ